jgi:septum formation protein
MLQLLSDTIHEVLTGVVVLAGDHDEQQVVRTRVHFLPLSSDEVDAYVRSGEPDGKAGAYAIQGRAARYIDWIEGSWSNVVGLPVATVHRLLKNLGA